MEKSGFFPSNEGTRVYKTDTIASFFAKMYTNGVFNNELRLVTNDNMTVTLKPGWAFINGYFYYNSEDKIFNISPADSNQSRIDNLVLRFNKENYEIVSEIIEGAYANSPAAPALERNSNIYDLRLYKIKVPAETGKITSKLIEDCRFNSNDCGNVINAVQHIDSTGIFTQYDAIFQEWFSFIKDQLSTDAAGNLQNQINDIVQQEIIAENYMGEELKTARNVVLKDAEGNILNPMLPLNLITDGPAIKTGFKRNGHDIYVKEISAPISIGENKTISLGLDSTDILCNWDAKIMVEGSGDVRVKAGFYAAADNFFSAHPNGNVISIMLGAHTEWIGNNKKVYITLWYEKVGEASSGN